MLKYISKLFIFILLVSCHSKGKTPYKIEELSKEVKRVGMVIKLKEETLEEYKRVHADDHEGVRDLLSKYGLRNFNIFLIKLDDGHYYEFGYYEYHGSDYETDMAKLAAEPRNIKWGELCSPMQIPLEGYEDWAMMEPIYFNP